MDKKTEALRIAALATLQKIARREAIQEYADKEKQRKANRTASEKQRAADKHRKIQLGGLVIVAGADGWDEAEIVGVLLAGAAYRATKRQQGIEHMVNRNASKTKAPKVEANDDGPPMMVPG